MNPDRIKGMANMKLISIISPCFNEEGNVQELHDRIAKVMEKLDYDYEHILIDNASTDRTVEILRAISAVDKRTKFIVNTRNFGQIRSPYHALFQTSGDAVVCMAADLQDPPHKWHGFEIFGNRQRDCPLFDAIILP